MTESERELIPHVVVNGLNEVILLAYNYRTAALAARFWNRALPVKCTIRPANENDVQSFMRLVNEEE